MQNRFILYTKHTFSEYEKIPLQIQQKSLPNTKRTPYKQEKALKTFLSSGLSSVKEGGYLLSRIALQYHRRKWA